MFTNNIAFDYLLPFFLLNSALLIARAEAGLIILPSSAQADLVIIYFNQATHPTNSQLIQQLTHPVQIFWSRQTIEIENKIVTIIV